MIRIFHVVGARPNFMKVSPIWAAFDSIAKYEQVLIHTGQHYDLNMSDIFFKELQIPSPKINFGVGSSSHAKQIAKIMVKLENELNMHKPDIVLVYGDVNSTIAAALVCSKLMIPIAHVEAGLRSFDRTMPEEINRILTDQISDFLFTPSKDANINLVSEGINNNKIHLVGNVMIDTLVKMLPKVTFPNIEGLTSEYLLLTLHRPSNVDEPQVLKNIISTMKEISNNIQILFSVHPRTRKILQDYSIIFSNENNIKLLNPLGYLDFLGLMKNALLVVTDSGGIQEETTFLNIPCLTLRENTERPITVELGTNQLIGFDMDLLKNKINEIMKGKINDGNIPELWDGKASNRIVKVISAYFK